TVSGKSRRLSVPGRRVDDDSTMPYVLRAPDGQILSLHREAEEVAEFLPPDDPQVLAFLNGDGGVSGPQFASLDADLVRVLEDLIDALIQRNILMVTDLPAQAQQ